LSKYMATMIGPMARALISANGVRNDIRGSLPFLRLDAFLCADGLGVNTHGDLGIKRVVT
jgi:hypothetical protein